jgi:hypothetical protein
MSRQGSQRKELFLSREKRKINQIGKMEDSSFWVAGNLSSGDGGTVGMVLRNTESLVDTYLSSPGGTQGWA